MRAVNVAVYPHTNEQGAAAIHQRLRHAAGFDSDGDRRYDQHGRLIITSGEEFAQWASDAKLAGVMVA